MSGPGEMDAVHRSLGVGAMRLSTERDRDEAQAVHVLHAALDAGATLVDTADAYCWDDGETGHNERLVARALASWSPPPGRERARVLVATKGGLTRPHGGWLADGRARHLVAACEASCRALGVSRIDLYQLHAPDPKVPLSTSMRALASLQRDGVVDRIGLCNVTVGQIEEARRLADISAVQVELSVWNDDHLLSGVVEFCLRHGIRVIAHRPLGGSQRARRLAADRLLSDLAASRGVAAADIALAWLMDLSDLITPIPGPTRVETASALVRPLAIDFTDAERTRLDERIPTARSLRRSGTTSASHVENTGELVLVMGLPAAGKSTVARSFVADGYARVNRDEVGGSLRGLIPAVHRLVASGCNRIVLDNTYVSRKSRAAVVHAAEAAGLAARCVWLTTSVEEAQVNAVSRMLAKYGRLLEPDEIRETVKRDVGAFGPGVQFRYQRQLEPPDPSERFARIDTLPFERRRDPSFTNRAVILWCDGVLAADRALAEVFVERGAVLRRYADDGWPILGLGWQPDVGDGRTTAANVQQSYERLQERLRVAMDILYCPHAAGPPVCWCRKPLPGLGVVFVERYRLDPRACIYVGSGPQDPGFARRLGFQYCDAPTFFERG